MELLRDTSPEQREKYFRLLRDAGEHGRARILVSLISGGRALVEAGVTAEHPKLNGRERQREIARRLYGPAVAERLFGSTSPRDE